ncbi:hypothetical protein B0J11DRAFT_584611 [Dendryphion nanum]|uniref:Uncharacterized protein n=1 Tax=Dendryphion nanum TaxID=256645 RepID=A0A9P9DAC2_9PLEO|nr:hypothetical protein B0J11DRAFT_584611 [Dendryphion nanum]
MNQHDHPDNAFQGQQPYDPAQNVDELYATPTEGTSYTHLNITQNRLPPHQSAAHKPGNGFDNMLASVLKETGEQARNQDINQAPSNTNNFNTQLAQVLAASRAEAEAAQTKFYEDQLAAVLAESKSDVPVGAPQSVDEEEQAFAAALAASYADIPTRDFQNADDEEEAIQRLLRDSEQQYYQIQLQHGALDDDDPELAEIKNRSMNDWHACMNKQSAGGHQGLDAHLLADLDPHGKGKGRRESDDQQGSLAHGMAGLNVNIDVSTDTHDSLAPPQWGYDLFPRGDNNTSSGHGGHSTSPPQGMSSLHNDPQLVTAIRAEQDIAYLASLAADQEESRLRKQPDASKFNINLQINANPSVQADLRRIGKRSAERNMDQDEKVILSLKMQNT